MTKSAITLLMAIGLSLVTVLGDYLIKEASLQKNFSGWKLLLTGAVLWGATALGWFYLMRREELSILGALYSVIIVISLFLIGSLLYKEQITMLETFGIILGIASIILLYRFN